MNNREDNNGMIQVRNDLGDLYITLNVLENQKENYIEKAKDEYNNGLNCLFHYPNILQSWRSLQKNQENKINENNSNSSNNNSNNNSNDKSDIIRKIIQNNSYIGKINKGGVISVKDCLSGIKLLGKLV